MTASIRTTFTGRLDARRAQVFAALAITMVLAVIAPFYKREIAQAVRAWLETATFNHCFLVIPIVLYLVWSRRDAIADVAPRPALLGLVPIAALSILWIPAATLDVIEARQFLFMGIVQGVFFTLLGAALYRRLLGPLLYLFFLVPSGEFLIPKLQDFTAKFAVAGLQLAGVPVYTDGVFIQIPEGTFVVAEACAGLRFLVASVAYGILFGLVVYSSWRRRLIFLGLSLVIPIIANGIRAFGIIFAAHIIGSAAAAEADHVLYGWLFFSIVIFLLTLAGMSFSDRARLDFAGSGKAVAIGLGSPARKYLVGAAVATALVAVSAPSLLIFVQGHAYPAEAAWLDLPAPASPWKLVAREPEWHPSLAGPDREFLDSFTNGQQTIERYVALFVSHGDNNILANLGRPAAGSQPWEAANFQTARVEIGGRSHEVEVNDVRSRDGRRRLVLSFYIVDAKVVVSTLRAKLLEAYASLIGKGHAVAYFAISIPVENADFNTQAELQQFLNSMSSLDSYIASVK